ncbi:MAG: hypothetical protein ACI9KE_002767 [Polyangiales bacterium]|jgi:hypothetical protein
MTARALLFTFTIFVGACGSTQPTPPQACESAADCSAGWMCDGSAGCDTGWTCVPERVCSTDSREYCACDGTTIRGSGSCPPAPFAHAGACE